MQWHLFSFEINTILNEIIYAIWIKTVYMHRAVQYNANPSNLNWIVNENKI